MSRRPRPGLRLAVAPEAAQPPLEALAPPRNLDKQATITIDDKTFEVQADDLEKIADLGRGAYGVVEKMRHIKTGTVMAVKRITATVNTQEQVRNRSSFIL
jgi:mitogen-activated protein kinase kinase 3